jgi:hypothetical protein
MTAYAGVTFTLLAEDGIWRPWWRQKSGVVRRHIPHSNRDDVQSVGRGNFTITLDAFVEDDTGVSTLQAAVGSTGRTLSSLFGTDYSNVRLTDVGEPRRWDYGAKWVCSLTFEREGS